jgi:hypothetical protein
MFHAQVVRYSHHRAFFTERLNAAKAAPRNVRTTTRVRMRDWIGE